MFNGEPKRFPKQIQKLYSIVRRMTVALYLSHARRLLSNALISSARPSQYAASSIGCLRVGEIGSAGDGLLVIAGPRTEN